jgi:hypothetical protein
MLLDDLADLLSTAGIGDIGTTADYAIFKGAMPDVPERAIVIHETGGFPTLHVMGPKNLIEYPRVQIVVRAPQYLYSTGRQKAADVFSSLDGVGRNINGVEYLWIEAVQPPFSIGVDKNLRPLIACNYDITRAMTSSM